MPTRVVFSALALLSVVSLAFRVPLTTPQLRFHRRSPLFMESGTGKGLSGPVEPSAEQKAQTLSVDPSEERFGMVYTCGQCKNRNLASVGKVAYTEGLVIVTCQHCGARHLVADNKNLMGVPEFGRNIEEYLEKKGTGDVLRTTLPEGVVLSSTDDGTIELRTRAEGVASQQDQVDEGMVATDEADEEEVSEVGTVVEATAEEDAEDAVALKGVEEEEDKQPPAPHAVEVPTDPIDGQKPGTSGLRKKVRVWQEGNYLHNFVQAMLDAWEDGTPASLVLGGDGRYFSETAVMEILRICAPNGVKEVYVGQGGVLSTPAVSAIIRKRRTDGGVVLTASHNPGGPDEDFGIKFNNKNGAPAPEGFTDRVYEQTKVIQTIRVLKDAPDLDLSALGTYDFGPMKVHVIDPAEDYVEVLGEQFDYGAIREFLNNHSEFSLCFDAMHGAAGPYAVKIFKEILQMQNLELLRCNPLPDFGGSHPDPNLKYAAALVERMGVDASGKPATVDSATPDLGAASDGDGDRNMVLGKGCFVTPSDSLAVIADWADSAIQGIQRNGGLQTVARSMPTSAAVDVVAEKKGIKCFATPTGWKFFGNLMDSDILGGEKLTPLICGEESFGTGSDHVREKDGIWAVLAWLSIIAQANSPEFSDAEFPEAGLVGVKEIMERHWRLYGRHLYSRWDFEGVGADGASDMIAYLRSRIGTTVAEDADDAGTEDQDAFSELISMVYGDSEDGDVTEPEDNQEENENLRLVDVEEFSYTDPTDGSVSTNQGVILTFDGAVSQGLSGKSRAVFRLSGTGSVGATVRMYLELYDENGASHSVESSATKLLRPLALAALEEAKMLEFTGVEEPTVMT